MAAHPPLSAHTLVRDGVRLHVTTAGEDTGTPVLLLHGWPDSAVVWRHQIGALAAAGHRVLAPDLRGFGRSDRPVDVAAYRLSESVADVLAILDAHHVDDTSIVAHDWGATLGWVLAAHLPERVRSLTVLSVGHPRANRAAGLAQMEKSFYMLLFLFEGVAERWLSDDDWARLRNWVGAHGEVDRWIGDLSRPGALTASLNWYRANLPAESWLRDPQLPAVRVPTMGIMGASDMALLPAQMEGSSAWVHGEWRYEPLPHAGHWAQIDAADAVSTLLVDWLSRFA